MQTAPFLGELDLHSAAGAGLLAKIQQRTSPQLAGVARRLVRLFRISSPFAPGFYCLGGEVELEPEAAAACEASRLSVTGKGETLEAALISCLGEAADLVSQFETPADVAATGSPEQFPDAVANGWMAQVISGAREATDWIEARNAAGGKTALLPADLCIRRHPSRRTIAFAGALSTGVAAGPDAESAGFRAALELCERDAAALWWLGGRRPKGFPLEHAGQRFGAALVERLRQGATRRRTLLLDITTDVGVPAVAAVSVCLEGRGLACGLAARLDPREAVEAAILEMCQMELAAPVAEAKRAERGEAALNMADRRHLRRAEFAAAECTLLHPCGLASLDAAGPFARGLDALIGRLNERGVRLFLLELTRPDPGVPVVRAVSPELQPFEATVSTERLQRARADSGGAAAATAAVPLM
jgi:thiazole/oxazole-forming peptide maturase SagD family component